MNWTELNWTEHLLYAKEKKDIKMSIRKLIMGHRFLSVGIALVGIHLMIYNIQRVAKSSINETEKREANDLIAIVADKQEWIETAQQGRCHFMWVPDILTVIS